MPFSCTGWLRFITFIPDSWSLKLERKKCWRNNVNERTLRGFGYILHTYLSHALSVQLAIKHRVSMKTSSTVPGHIFIKVLTTNFMSKLIRLSAPMLREAASENRMLCRSIVRQMRYRRRNIGSDRNKSIGTLAVLTVCPSASTCLTYYTSPDLKNAIVIQFPTWLL